MKVYICDRCETQDEKMPTNAICPNCQSGKMIEAAIVRCVSCNVNPVIVPHEGDQPWAVCDACSDAEREIK